MLMRMQSNGNSHIQQSLRKLTYKPTIPLLVTYPTSTKFAFRKKSLYANVYSDSIHNHQKLGKIQMLFSWSMITSAIMLWMDTFIQWSPTYQKISNKHLTTGMNFKCINKWKNPDTKGYILYDSVYVTFWKRQTLGTGKRWVVVREQKLDEALTTVW